MENLLNLPRQPDRWYREPWLLLVFGGPLLVILACIATIYLAITHPDPVVSKDYYREGVRINARLAAQKAAEQAGPSSVSSPAAQSAKSATTTANPASGVAP